MIRRKSRLIGPFPPPTRTGDATRAETKRNSHFFEAGVGRAAGGAEHRKAARSQRLSGEEAEPTRGNYGPSRHRKGRSQGQNGPTLVLFVTLRTRGGCLGGDIPGTENIGGGALSPAKTATSPPYCWDQRRQTEELEPETAS